MDNTLHLNLPSADKRVTRTFLRWVSLFHTEEITVRLTLLPDGSIATAWVPYFATDRRHVFTDGPILPPHRATHDNVLRALLVWDTCPLQDYWHTAR